MSYTADEQKVVDYLLEIMPEIGAGDDPIAFLIASHGSLYHTIKELKRENAQLKAERDGD